MSANAASQGLLGCRVCGVLHRRPPHERRLACVRCGATLHARKPYGVARAWALLIAAYVLYLPANLLPILETTSIHGRGWDTIMSGVVKLWRDGWWPLSLILFGASIVIPLVKLLALTYLLVSVRYNFSRYTLERARLYRVIDIVGKWSMVDLFVGALLVGLVRFEPVAAVAPGPGAIAFGTVVVLTMFASQSFDPRLLWENGGESAGERRG